MTPAMFTKLSFALLALPSLICPIFAAPAPLSCRSVITRICNTASNSPNSLENFFQSNSNILISHGLADEDPFQARLSLCGKDHGANTQWPEPSINGNSQSIPAFILMDRITKSGQNQESARAIVCYENPEDNTDDPSSKTSLLALQLAMVMALMACGLELVIITVNWRIARESRQQSNCDNKPASHGATCTLSCHLSQECLGPNTTNDTVYPPRTGLLGTETFYSDSEDEDDEISRPIM